MDALSTWEETMAALAVVTGDAGAQEWLRQVLHATWGVHDVGELNRAGRALALQRMIGTTLMLLDGPLGDMAGFVPDGGRQAVRDAFARRWGGVVLDGPPWQMGPCEQDRPTYEQWAATAADFG